LTLPREQAGQRIPCPACDGMLKVPVAIPSPDVTGSASAGQVAVEGAGSDVQFALICPQCQATLRATSAQIGEEIVCSDCLEGVRVEAPVTAGGESPETIPEAPLSPSEESVPEFSLEPLSESIVDSQDLPLAPLSSGDLFAEPDVSESWTTPPEEIRIPPPIDGGEAGMADDELVLAPPEDLGPKVPDIMDSIKAAEARSDAKFGGQGMSGVGGTSKDDSEDVEFGFNCSVCDTRLHARRGQTGQTLRCPDCFTEHVVPTAPPAPAKPQPAKRETASDEFLLEEPVAPSFPGAAGGELNEGTAQKNARKLLADAEAELEAEYAEEAELDSEPPLLQLLSFLVDPTVLLTVMGCGVSFGFWLCCLARVFSPDTMTRLLAIVGTLATSVVSLLALAFLLAACLKIVTETSAGNQRISEWPGFDVGEWLWNLLTLFNPLWMSGLPGLAVGLLISFGLGTGGGFVLIFASWLVFFPLVMHGMNETQSSLLPFSMATMQSIQEHSRQWGMFYITSAALLLFCSAIFCGLISSSAWAGAWITNPIGCGLLTTLMMIYFRLFGWHVWRLNELDHGGYQRHVAGRD